MEGCALLSIHFESQHDCVQIYEQLINYLQKYKDFGVNVNINQQENETIIQINYEDSSVNFYDSFHPLLVSVLTNHVISTREEGWLVEIIENVFYFKDEEEQNQILTIARSILAGDREEIPNHKQYLQKEHYIYEAFAKGIDEETVFYYDPFLTFRLKKYGEMLIECVQLAIDEYFLEQEYQNLIEGLRFYLKTMPTKIKVVHLVYSNKFTFYNDQYRVISREERTLYLDEKIVFEGNLDIDEIVVSPLVSMNPEVVFIYVDDEHRDHAVIVTLQAVFQEKLKILPFIAFRQRTSNSN